MELDGKRKDHPADPHIPGWPIAESKPKKRSTLPYPEPHPPPTSPFDHVNKMRNQSITASGHILKIPAELRQTILSHVAEDIATTDDGNTIRSMDPNASLICDTLFYDAMELTKMWLPADIEKAYIRFVDRKERTSEVKANPMQDIAHVVVGYIRLARTTLRAQFGGINVEVMVFDQTELLPGAHLLSLVEHQMNTRKWSHFWIRGHELHRYINNLRIDLKAPLLCLTEWHYPRDYELTQVYWSATQFLCWVGMRCFHDIFRKGTIKMVGEAPFEHQHHIARFFNKPKGIFSESHVVFSMLTHGWLKFEVEMKEGRGLQEL